MDDFYAPPLAEAHDAFFTDHARRAAGRLLEGLAASGHEAGTVIDLGSGSGVLAEIVSAAGFDVLGVDLSAAMVDIARRRAPRASFVQGSIWDVELVDAVAVTAIGEIVNYAADRRTGTDQLRRLFAAVRAVLAPGGVLLFDVATPGRAGPDGTTTGFRDHGGHVVVHRSHETVEDGVPMLERRITLFTRDAGTVYRRSDEVHRLLLYDPEQVAAMLAEAGFAASSGHLDGDAQPLPGWMVFEARPTGHHAG